MWSVITLYTVIGVASAYTLSGVYAAHLIGGKAFMWLPLIALAIGAIMGFLSGASMGAWRGKAGRQPRVTSPVPCPARAAVALAGIYVSIPYTLSQSSAVTLGLAQAIIVIYLSLGRGGFSFM